MEREKFISSRNPDVSKPSEHHKIKQVISAILCVAGIVLIFTNAWDVGALTLLIGTIIFLFRKTDWQ